MQYRFQQWIVGAAEQKDICRAETVAKGFLQINSRNLLGYGMFYPSFLDQRNQKGAGFFTSLHLQFGQLVAIGMAADGRFSSNDHYFSIVRGSRSLPRSRLDHPYNLYRHGLPDLFECQRGCRITSNDQKLSALLLEKPRGLTRIPSDGLN